MQAQSSAPVRIDLTGIHATQVLVALRAKPQGVADSTLARMLGSGQTGQMNLSSALRRLSDRGYRCPLYGDKRGRCKRVLRADPKVTLYDPNYGAVPEGVPHA